MVQFIDLWRGHPLNASVVNPCIADRPVTNLAGKPIAAGDPVYLNQAAIRMGVALRRSGVRYEDLGKVLTCGAHDKGELHCVNARQLADALRRAKLAGFGPMEILSGGDVENFYARIFGRTGVLYIQEFWLRQDDKEGHPTGDLIDVWNGYRSSTNWLMDWFNWAGYRSHYAQAREIWFWPVA